MLKDKPAGQEPTQQTSTVSDRQLFEISKTVKRADLPCVDVPVGRGLLCEFRKQEGVPLCAGNVLTASVRVGKRVSLRDRNTLEIKSASTRS